ncbi:thermonuclease family protein [Candidatus Saccharibacteria bacterium]|nr:thermonuclease family protein [Candidatus Saccharibacteria bacterium]
MPKLHLSKKRLIKLLFSILILMIGYYLSTHPSVSRRVNLALPAGTYEVARFDDGDTIAVKMNGREEQIRFIGVDTPETHDPRKQVQCFGHAAADYTRQQIGSQSVRLETDPLGTNRDRYDRLLRYVYLPDGRLLNSEIIREGYGFAYTSFPFTKSAEFKAHEISARHNNRGLWADCKPIGNQYGGFTSNDAQ